MSENDFEVLLAKKTNFKDIPVISYMGNDGWASTFMRENHSNIKMNQLRNFFTEINAIKGLTPEAKVKLETNLAYDYGRNVITKEFFDIVSRSLTKTRNDDDFKKFVMLIESLIAYHKFYNKEKDKENE